MKLDEFKQLGAFVDTRPVMKTVKWKIDDGNEVQAEIAICRLGFADVEAVRQADEKGDKNFVANMISKCVVFDGEHMSYEQAGKLDPRVAGALIEAIGEVHGGPKA